MAFALETEVFFRAGANLLLCFPKSRHLSPGENTPLWMADKEGTKLMLYHKEMHETKVGTFYAVRRLADRNDE